MAATVEIGRAGAISPLGCLHRSIASAVAAVTVLPLLLQCYCCRCHYVESLPLLRLLPPRCHDLAVVLGTVRLTGSHHPVTVQAKALEIRDALYKLQAEIHRGPQGAPWESVQEHFSLLQGESTGIPIDSPPPYNWRMWQLTVPLAADPCSWPVSTGLSPRQLPVGFSFIF